MFPLILLASLALASPARAPSFPEKTRGPGWFTATATAFAADCPGMRRKLTDGSPTDWTRRSVALDLDHYPLGTRVEICFDDGTCRAYTGRDSGDDIQGRNRVDILVRSCSYATEFGRQQVRIRVLGGSK